MYKNLSKLTQILGGIAGVVLVQVSAPVYVANGNGEAVVRIAREAVIGLGAAIAIRGPAAIAIGLMAPLAFGGIFLVFGETASGLDQR